jgi:pimeloyl-ACP methyl ester carboxylesterase
MTVWAFLTLVAAVIPVQSKFAPLTPADGDMALWQRSEGRDRAVILIHGFKLHPFSDEHVCKPEWHIWQRPGGELSKALGRDADIFGFAYGQNATIEQIAHGVALTGYVRQLKAMGYREIVMIGHSTGGVIAREFVEDNPQAGVTKVIQVCSPNAGSSLARNTFAVRKIQEPLVRSLTCEARQQCLRERTDCKIPPSVEFVCVVGRLPYGKDDDKKDGKNDDSTDTVPPGDGVVAVDSQWSDDLRRQGIPAVLLPMGHNSVLRTASGIEKVAELVREKQPRWTAEKVAEQKRMILSPSK